MQSATFKLHLRDASSANDLGSHIGSFAYLWALRSARREFVRFVEIALRDAREATHWPRICAALELAPSDHLKQLGGEGDQISRAVFGFCILNFALVS
jgi:hypothetical protein